MTKRASKERTTGAILREIRGDQLREAGLLGRPVQRAWTQKNGRAAASKAACRQKVVDW